MAKDKKSLVYRLKKSSEVEILERIDKELEGKLFPTKSKEMLLDHLKSRYCNYDIKWKDVELEGLGNQLISFESNTQEGGVFIIHYNGDNYTVFKGDIGYQWCEALTQYKEDHS